MQRDGNAVGRDVDPLDQQPQDARLLGRVEFVPDPLERAEDVDDLAFGDAPRYKIINSRMACGRSLQPKGHATASKGPSCAPVAGRVVRNKQIRRHEQKDKGRDARSGPVGSPKEIGIAE